MNGEWKDWIPFGVAAVVWVVAFFSSTWWLKRKAARPKTVGTADHLTLQQEEDGVDSRNDKEIVTQNPGNHAAVIRLIVKAETVDEIDKLYDDYIDSSSHHKAYEIDVVAVHYWKKSQLLKDEDERGKWYMGGRIEILRKQGFTLEQFIKALSDAEKKYPELLEDW